MRCLRLLPLIFFALTSSLLPQSNPRPTVSMSSPHMPFGHSGTNRVEASALVNGASPTSVLDFLPTASYSSGGYAAQSVAVADVNGDGKPDLLVANLCQAMGACGGQGEVGVLLGNGDGTFQPAVTYLSGGLYAQSVAVADVNGDGKPDLLVASRCSINTGCAYSAVGVLLGNGDGTFQPAVAYGSGGYDAESVAVGDVNGDGTPDLLVANAMGSVGVLLGKGDGTFRPVVAYGSGGYGTNSVAAGDVNGDGDLDLVTTSSCATSPINCDYYGIVAVLLGNGDGTFRPAVSYNADRLAESVAVADVNGDGNPDLIVASQSHTVGVMLGNGDGTFQTPVTYNPGGRYANWVAVADVNGDGKPDLLVANLISSNIDDAGGAVGVLLGNGDGTFQPALAYGSGGRNAGSLAVADVNGDGKPDVLVANSCESQCANGSVGVLLNNYGATPTTTSLVSSMNPLLLSKVVTYTATVESQSGGTLNGTVAFTDGSTTTAIVTLASNQAAYSTSYQKIGPHPITATYSGDLHNAAGSISATLTEYAAGTSKTVVTTSGSPSLVGQPVTFTATVTSYYGKIPDSELVAFYDGSKPLASVALAGGKAAYTTSTLSGKTHIIKVAYVGDTKFAPSFGQVKQIVSLYSTTTTLTSSQNPSTYGQAVTLTATVSSGAPGGPTGTVTFKNGTTSLGMATLNASGVATLTKKNFSAGTDSVTAVYNGDAQSAKSASAVFPQTVRPAVTSTTITSSLNPSAHGQTVTFTAKVASPTTIPTGTVTFKDGATSLATVNLVGGKAIYSTSTLSVGSHTMTAAYNGTPNITSSKSPARVQTVH